MLFLSLFLAGFTLGIFFALTIFRPERQEEIWDPQNIPGYIPKYSKRVNQRYFSTKINILKSDKLISLKDTVSVVIPHRSRRVISVPGCASRKTGIL
jgi:hypothetical protein